MPGTIPFQFSLGSTAKSAAQSGGDLNAPFSVGRGSGGAGVGISPILLVIVGAAAFVLAKRGKK